LSKLRNSKKLQFASAYAVPYQLLHCSALLCSTALLPRVASSCCASTRGWLTRIALPLCVFRTLHPTRIPRHAQADQEKNAKAADNSAKTPVAASSASSSLPAAAVGNGSAAAPSASASSPSASSSPAIAAVAAAAALAPPSLVYQPSDELNESDVAALRKQMTGEPLGTG
jgi:hypothetical protein